MLKGYKRLLALSALMSGSSPVEDTATGNPVAFVTDLAKPLVSLEIPFTPQQEGTGDPSPSNIRPIVPWDGLTVEHGGRNLFDVSNFDWNKGRESDPIYRVNADGTLTVIANDSRAWANLPRVEGLPKGKYVLQWSGTGTLYARYSTDTSVIVSTNGHIKLTIDDDNTGFVIKIITSSFPETGTVQIVSGETPLSYEPYKPITSTDIVFPSPVYGGTLDVVSGVLSVQYGFITLDDSVPVALANWRPADGTSAWLYALSEIPSDTSINSAICDKAKQALYGSIYNGAVGVATNVLSGDYGLAIRVPVENLSTKEAIYAYLAENPYHVAYQLATPREIQLTQQQITALVGNNTIWSDANGDLTVTFLKKG